MDTGKYARKIGFTDQEFKVVLFLVVVFLISAGLKFILSGSRDDAPKNFNYSKEDSIFLNQTYGTAEDIVSPVEKKDDTGYKEKVLRLSESERLYDRKALPSAASININTADAAAFSRLPGIGIKTAEKIVLYRDSRGGFDSLGELIKVKGIGKVKLSKIKPYLKM